MGHCAAEERLNDLMLESHHNGHRLAIMARQYEVLTSRTQAILDRTKPVVTPAVTPIDAIKPYRGSDEPLVLYEAEPVRKGGRQ